MYTHDQEEVEQDKFRLVSNGHPREKQSFCLMVHQDLSETM